MEIRKYFQAARKRRDLSAQKVADSLSDRFGRRITRATLASWELGRVDTPRQDVMEAIQWQLDQWRIEDQADGLPVPEVWTREWFSADYICPTCEHKVPGSTVGAQYCLWCGENLGPRTCAGCGKTVEDAAFLHCPYCGQELAVRVKL